MTFITIAGEFQIPLSNDYTSPEGNDASAGDSLTTQFRTRWESNHLVYEENEKSKSIEDGIKVRQKGHENVIWARTESGDLTLDGTSWAFALIGPIPVMQKSTINCTFKKVQ
ncbi:MAG: hypothetical protein ACXWR0_17950 [Bdellovibrio sp.]